MPRVEKHWIYQAFLSLADANGKLGLNLSEAEARATIKGWLPTFAHMVDAVVAANGDLSKLPEDMVQQTQEVIEREHQQRSGNDAMNKAVRDRVSGRFAAKVDGQDEYQSDNQSGDMNAKLRQRQSRIPPGTEESGMNDALRRAADRG